MRREETMKNSEKNFGNPLKFNPETGVGIGSELKRLNDNLQISVKFFLASSNLNGHNTAMEQFIEVRKTLVAK